MSFLIDALRTSFSDKLNAHVDAFRKIPFSGLVALLALLVAALGSAQVHLF